MTAAIKADITGLKVDAIVNAAHVIHTVGPVWHGGGSGEAGLLAACYRRCMEIAAAKGLKSIAFPSISTGVYDYPVEAAARVAVDTVRAFLAGPPATAPGAAPLDVTFCCFSDRDLEVYKRLLA